MAPKGKKRTATAGADDPAAKRVKDFLKEHNVSKSDHEAVREIVQHPDAGLAEDCRSMLLAMLPWSLSIPADARHEVQTGIVQMVEEVVVTIKAKLEASFQAENAAVTEQDAKRAALAQAVTEAKAAVEAADVAEKAAKAELAEATAASKRQKKEIAEALAKEKTENKAFDKLSAEKAHLEKMAAENLAQLKSGEWQDAKQCDALFKPIQALLPTLTLDESLATSLPSVMTKKERGPFDQVVVTQFEESLRAKIAEVAGEVQAMQPQAAANNAAVEEAKKVYENMLKTQEDAESKMANAQVSQQEAEKKLKQAEKAHSGFEPEYKKATAARSAKEEQLKTFTEYNMVLFRMLADRVTKKDEPAAAEEGAPADGAGA